MALYKACIVIMFFFGNKRREKEGEKKGRERQPVAKDVSVILLFLFVKSC